MAIATIYDPIDFYDFPLTVLNPFQMFMAPDEEWINLDEFVNELLLLILCRDVLPFTPMHDEILLFEGTLSEILDPFVSDTSCLSSACDSSAFPMVHIKPKDIPFVVKPDNVVWRVLWAEIIPNLPLTAVNRASTLTIDEWIDQMTLG
jgi:hypothetical protein